MNWRFWQPRHTVASVTERLAAGLRDGSIVMDEPLENEPLEDANDPDKLVLQMDVPAGSSNEEILEIVKQCVIGADAQNRNHGGHGLVLEAVRIETPTLKVALRPRNANEQNAPA